MDFDEVADRLYALSPGDFTASRGDYTKQAKAAGEAELAARIAALRKPTTVAWLANAFVHEHPDEIDELLTLGQAMRDAAAHLSGPQLRDLSRQRHQLVYALVQQARPLAARAMRKLTDDVARELEGTFTAAVNDADAGEQLRRARLTVALQPGGFGPAGSKAPAAATGPARTAARPGKATPADPPDTDEDDRQRAFAQQRVQQIERLTNELKTAQTAADRSGGVRATARAAAVEAAEALAAGVRDVSDLRQRLERAERAVEDAERAAEEAAAAARRAEQEAAAADAVVTDVQGRLDEL